MEFKNSSNQVVASVSTDGDLNVSGSVTSGGINLSSATVPAINELSGVSINTPTNGQVLKYNGTSWINGTDNAGTTISGLDDIGNVTAPSPSNGDFLKWNGSAWINDPINLGTDTTGNYMSGISGGTGISVSHTPGEGSSATVSLNANLDALSDVVISGPPSTNQVLLYDGVTWTNAAAPAGDTYANITSTSYVDVQYQSNPTFALNKLGALSVGTRIRAYNSQYGTWIEGIIQSATSSPSASITIQRENYFVSNGVSGAFSWTISLAGSPSRVLLYSSSFSSSNSYSFSNVFSNAYSTFDFEMEYYYNSTGGGSVSNNNIIAARYISDFYGVYNGNYYSSGSVFGSVASSNYGQYMTDTDAMLFTPFGGNSSSEARSFVEGKFYYPMNSSRYTTMRSSGWNTTTTWDVATTGFYEGGSVLKNNLSVFGINIFSANQYGYSVYPPIYFDGNIKIYGNF